MPSARMAAGPAGPAEFAAPGRAGTSDPSSSRRNDVFPLPLTPTSPARSPGASCQVTSFSSTRGPAQSVTSSTSMTVLPSRAVARLVSSTVSRAGGSSAISAVAACTRNFGLVERACGPRRSHASSLRIRLRRRRCTASAFRSRSAWASTYAEYPPSYGYTCPDSTSHIRSQAVSSSQRSWLTTTSAEPRSRRCRPSQSIASRSRWLVGSSSSRTSRSAASSDARAVRRRSPPESRAASAFRSMPPSSSATTPRARGSLAHRCSAVSLAAGPNTACRTVPDSSSRWRR